MMHFAFLDTDIDNLKKKQILRHSTRKEASLAWTSTLDSEIGDGRQRISTKG